MKYYGLNVHAHDARIVGRLTGHDCMINTSLNGKGKPICNTYQDAFEDFKDKDIELVSISHIDD